MTEEDNKSVTSKRNHKTNIGSAMSLNASLNVMPKRKPSEPVDPFKGLNDKVNDQHGVSAR